MNIPTAFIREKVQSIIGLTKLPWQSHAKELYTYVYISYINLQVILFRPHYTWIIVSIIWLYFGLPLIGFGLNYTSCQKTVIDLQL